MWAQGLTQAEATQIERVQKCALHVILGTHYGNYQNALEILKTEKLSVRRSKLCLKFIKRCEKSTKYSSWLKISEQSKAPKIQTRSQNKIQTKYKQVPFRTERYGRSPLPYLTTLLNEHYENKK